MPGAAASAAETITERHHLSTSRFVDRIDTSGSSLASFDHATRWLSRTSRRTPFGRIENADTSR
jgi:hypothetical protein